MVMHGMLYANPTIWRVARVSPCGDLRYTIEAARGMGDEADTAYVDVEAWETRAGDCHLTVVAAERDAVTQSAVAWVNAQDEHELAVLVLDWPLRRAS